MNAAARSHVRRSTWRTLLLAWLASAASLAQQPLPPFAPTTSDATTSPVFPPGAPLARLPGIDPRECGTSQWAALCAGGRWALFSRMTITARIAGFEGHYTIEQAQSGEVHVTYRELAPKSRRGGEAIVVSEDAFAYRSRDKFDEQRDVLDQLMASPIRVSQLATVLLDQAVLGAPDDVIQPMAVTRASATQFIRTESAFTTTLYGPPWRVRGSVRAIGPSQVGFNLRLTYRPVDPNGKVQESSATIDLAGTAVYAERVKVMNGSIDLVGWKLMKKDQPLPEVSTLRDAREAAGVQ